MTVTVPATPEVVINHCVRGHFYVRVDGTWVCCRCRHIERETAHHARTTG